MPPLLSAPPMSARRPYAGRSRPFRAPVPRETLSPGELLAAMNHALGRHSECAGVRLGVARWTHAVPGEPSNWCETSLVVRVHGSASPNVFACLREVIADARARYDVHFPD